jgi:hypothetical protein
MIAGAICDVRFVRLGVKGKSRRAAECLHVRAIGGKRGNRIGASSPSTAAAPSTWRDGEPARDAGVCGVGRSWCRRRGNRGTFGTDGAHELAVARELQNLRIAGTSSANLDVAVGRDREA